LNGRNAGQSIGRTGAVTGTASGVTRLNSAVRKPTTGAAANGPGRPAGRRHSTTKPSAVTVTTTSAAPRSTVTAVGVSRPRPAVARKLWAAVWAWAAEPS